MHSTIDRQDALQAGTRSRAATVTLRMVALTIVLGTALLFASVATASADSLSITIATATPEQAIPVSLTFSGSTSQSSSLLAVARPSGGIPCQPSYGSDITAAGGANQVLFGYDDRDENPGSFTEQTTYTPQNPGGYLVCAWIESNDGNTVTAGPIAATFTARGPQVPVLSVALAGAARPNKGFQINYTTQTDQQLNLYSVVKPAGALPCASTYDLELQQNQVEQIIYGYDDQQVFGGPTTTTATSTEQKAGAYLICTWIEGPNSKELDASVSTPIYVGTPPQPPACRVPTLATGTALSKVKQTIVADHCTVGAVTYAYSRTVRKGGLLSLSPASGTKLRSGAPVAARVSSGPRPATCRVPLVRPGSTLGAARRAITAAHCGVGTVLYRHDAHVRRGRVIGVAPRPGTLRGHGSRVAITVSSGPKPRRHHAG